MMDADEHGEGSEKCMALQSKYHEACLPTWVTYFDTLRKRMKAQNKPWRSPNVSPHISSSLASPDHACVVLQLVVMFSALHTFVGWYRMLPLKQICLTTSLCPNMHRWKGKRVLRTPCGQDESKLHGLQPFLVLNFV
jgi:hypothetical protein